MLIVWLLMVSCTVVLSFVDKSAFTKSKSSDRLNCLIKNTKQSNSKNENDVVPEQRLVKSDNILMQKWIEISPDTKFEIKSTLLSFVIAFAVRLFLFEPRYIPSLSMFPTFDVGDQLVVDKISHVYRPYQRRDVVVFNPTQTFIEWTGNTEALIKRIVAVGGDVVEVKDSKLFVNGVLQEEPYVNELPDYTLEPTTVPTGMLLVLGDNRNHSFDSHCWGFLPEKNVIGRAVVKYWPLGRAGLIEGST